MPFHYAEAPTNLLTSDALDPVCGITELKVCGCQDRTILVEKMAKGN